MLDGLRWFERYVPKTLVSRLMRVQGRNAVVSHQREVTVLFTDIVGFTGLSERMSATQVADLLNDHFSLLAACIEAEGGTVDKFIGDSVMAIWGAPESYHDGAARACRAALAIADAVRADNAMRGRPGKPRVRVRIGVHTGPVVVGNIGSPGRVNYTVVGDTVNTAKRLDELGKVLADDDETVPILISAETADALDGFDMEPMGARRIRGRSEPVRVFALKTAERAAHSRPIRRKRLWRDGSIGPRPAQPHGEATEHVLAAA